MYKECMLLKYIIKTSVYCSILLQHFIYILNFIGGIRQSRTKTEDQIDIKISTGQHENAKATHKVDFYFKHKKNMLTQTVLAMRSYQIVNLL